MTTLKPIISNGEKFTPRTYMGVVILVRDVDGYINAAKMGSRSKRVADYINAKKKQNGKNEFDELVEDWNSEEEFAGVVAKYELDRGYNNQVAGIYVHPELAHDIAYWVDKSYARKVRKIMNDLNKQLHYIMEDNNLPDEPVVAKRLLDSAEVELKVKDAEIASLKEQVETLTDENKDLKIDINVLGLKKKKLGIKLKRLERKQFDRDVRTNLCYRNVKILKDGTTYYFSADHQKRYRKLPVVHQFVFPSNMNVRREVKRWMENEFKREVEAVPSFTEAELPAVLDYVRSLEPKEIIHFINHSI